jgi:hypothetical protein
MWILEPQDNQMRYFANVDISAEISRGSEETSRVANFAPMKELMNQQKTGKVSV